MHLGRYRCARLLGSRMTCVESEVIVGVTESFVTKREDVSNRVIGTECRLNESRELFFCLAADRQTDRLTVLTDCSDWLY
jgi:hypothetical protein